MEERYSHPAEEHSEPVHLLDHLSDVVSRIQQIVPSDAHTTFDPPLMEIVEPLGWLHDFGKLTTWFQTFIRTDQQPEGPKHHSPLGATASFFALRKLGMEEEVCLAGYVAVDNHHGVLPNIADTVYNQNRNKPPGSRRRADIKEQINNITENSPDLGQEMFSKATRGKGTLSELSKKITSDQLFDDIQQQVTGPSGLYSSDDQFSDRFYPALLRMWGTLNLADKTSASGAPTKYLTAVQPDSDRLSSFIDELSESEREREEINRLNELRSEARNNVRESVQDWIQSDQDLATISLPTGLGKTLTGLEAALEVRDRTDRRRIIYALPFTSIIDQVVEELQTIYDLSVTGRELTVHHHLSDTRVSLSDQPAAEVDKTDEHAGIEELLGKSWRSGIVVTTFVQLFETLAGPGNMQSVKLPAMQDSVIILDEPQSLPHEWWDLTNRLIHMLTDQYNAAVISMTATQPALFQQSARELVPDPDRYSKEIQRTTYHIDQSVKQYGDEEAPRTYTYAAEQICQNIASDDILSICNTIDAASELTEELRNRNDWMEAGSILSELYERHAEPSADQLIEHMTRDRDAQILFHLTTRHRPKDRLLLIETIERLLEQGEHRVMVVSTQLIEAGVDLSFDRVYRDFAPVVNIVQAAGRCNRSFERDRGTVTVWWMDAPEGAQLTPGEAVYDHFGNSLLKITRDVITSVKDGEIETMTEPEMNRKAVRLYYDRLEERGAGKSEWPEYIRSARGETLRDLSLIDQRRSIEVLIVRSDTEKERVEDIRRKFARGAYRSARNELEALRTCQISIPVYEQDSEEEHAFGQLPKLSEEAPMRVLDVRNNKNRSYFEPVLGAQIPKSTVDRRIL